MQRGLYRGVARAPEDDSRRGLVIARARSASVHTGVTATSAATGTDITGLGITFDVLPGEEVELEVEVAFCYGSAIGVYVGIAICDAANTELRAVWQTSSTAASITGTAKVSELITTAGSGLYRKARIYKASGTGNANCGVDARFEHQIKATVG